MFICAITGKVSEPHEKMIKVVVETRPRTYTNFDEDGVEIISRGSEIVKEIGVTQAGFDEMVKREVGKLSVPGNGGVNVSAPTHQLTKAEHAMAMKLRVE